MKISTDITTNNTSTSLPTGKTTNKPGKTGVDTESMLLPSAQVSLSAASQAVLAAGVGSEEPVFDANKVEQIKAAIVSGQFQVNPERIADGLLATVKDLLISQ
jgi:negative regulator of flagellin synthesis FlgM